MRSLLRSRAAALAVGRSAWHARGAATFALTLGAGTSIAWLSAPRWHRRATVGGRILVRAETSGSRLEAAQSPGDQLWHPSWIAADGERTIARRKALGDKEDKLKLYTSWFCPFAQRAWIALEEKDVDYLYVEINPYKVDASLPGGYTKKQLPLDVKKAMYPDFVASSPRGLVPAVSDPANGDRVWESMHAVQYIDERYDRAPHFLPRDSPVKRAHVRIWSDFATERMQRSFYTMLMEQAPAKQEQAKQAFFEECRTFARAMSEEGPYFMGKDISMVDIALFPFWQRFLWVGGHYRNLQMPEDPEFQRLNLWWEATSARPAFKATLVCQDRLVSSYSQYSRNEGTSDYAKSLQSSLSVTKAARP